VDVVALVTFRHGIACVHLDLRRDLGVPAGPCAGGFVALEAAPAFGRQRGHILRAGRWRDKRRARQPVDLERAGCRRALDVIGRYSFCPAQTAAQAKYRIECTCMIRSFLSSRRATPGSILRVPDRAGAKR